MVYITARNIIDARGKARHKGCYPMSVKLKGKKSGKGGQYTYTAIKK